MLLRLHFPAAAAAAAVVAAAAGDAAAIFLPMVLLPSQTKVITALRAPSTFRV